MWNNGINWKILYFTYTAFSEKRVLCNDMSMHSLRIKILNLRVGFMLSVSPYMKKNIADPGVIAHCNFSKLENHFWSKFIICFILLSNNRLWDIFDMTKYYLFQGIIHVRVKYITTLLILQPHCTTHIVDSNPCQEKNNCVQKQI